MARFPSLKSYYKYETTYKKKAKERKGIEKAP
jgi:hypothetical protein